MKSFNSQENFINNLKEIKSNRSSLVGEKFDIISMMGEVKYEVEVKKLIGEGGSSLVYEVEVDDTYPPLKKMIMKEFYPNYDPDHIEAERNPINGLELYFDAETREDEQRIKKDRTKFIDAYNKHIRILDMDSYLDDKIVRPYRVETDNAFLYSLYEVDSATSVDKYYNLDLSRIIDILIQASDILSHLHNNDIIYMDLKPANILYDYNKNKVKLFDFDAAVDLNELDRVNEFSMPSEKAFIPPEIRFVTDISKRKDIFITEEIDLYMLGATFFTLLMGRPPVNKENEDMDFLERNVRDVLNLKTNKILINKKAEDEIVSILQETLSIHRLISVSDFKDRLIQIDRNIRFKDNEEFASIISSAYFIDYHRLYDYIVEDEDGKSIDVAIVSYNDISKIFFSFIFSVANIDGVSLNISFYDKNPKKIYREMISENPLLAETARIYLNNKLVNDYINPNITNKAYANINFLSSKEKIDQSYILILDQSGFNYAKLGDILYKEFKDDQRKRIILNYSRNNHEVDFRHEENIQYYNLDMMSTTAFKDKDFNNKLLDEAFEFFRLHSMSNYGQRVDNDLVWSRFIDDGFYNLKSSLRLALSIEYSKYMAGIKDDDDDVALKFTNQVIKLKSKKDSYNTRDMLADLEHHSWNRFMIVQGFTIPTDSQLQSYSFVDQRNYVDYRNKYHPLIANTSAKDLKEGKTDQLELVSNRLDRLIKEKTVHKEEQVKFRMLNVLNNTIWDYNIYLKKLKPLWIDLVRLSYEIIENEFYASNLLNKLTYEIEKVLDEASPDLKIISMDYYQIKSDLSLIIKRNKKIDIKSVDYMIIDSIPLVSSKRVKTVYKPFLADDENIWANIIAAIKFNPEKLIFLSDEAVDRRIIDRIENFLKNKRLQKSIQVELISYDQMKYYNKENAIVDLTLNSHADGKREEFAGLEFVEYTGFNNWSGNYKALDYYIYKSSLTVEETFSLNNAEIYENINMVGITRLLEHYPKIWNTYLSLDSDSWADFVKAIKANVDYYIFDIDNFSKKRDHKMIEVGNFIFKKNDYAKYTSLKTVLDELVDEKIIIDYQFPINPGRLKIHSYNNELSKSLGDFISRNMWEYNMKFRLIRTELAEKNYEYNYKIYSDKLNFTYQHKAENLQLSAKEINNIMEYFDKDNDGSTSRVFNKIANKAYAKDIDGKVELNYEFGDLAFRQFFSLDGRLLRVYTYFELVKYSDFFDDIKIRVHLRWKAYDDYSEDSLPIENVLDIVCTKGFSTIIISTVEGNIRNEDLYEINNYTKQFGMDAKPVLVTSNSDDDTRQIKMIADAAGVYLIDRQMLVENNVADYIKNIALGKKDWKNV